jgi:ankyrin repeat protein
LESALFYASGFGQTDVLEYLLARGLNPAAADRDGQTVLHWAVIGGHIRTVDLLLRKKVPLENRNAYGGTPLGQALWSAAHGGDAYTYIDILDLLQAAGAEIPERHAPINRRVDAWLAEHGSKREADWSWQPKDLEDAP